MSRPLSSPLARLLGLLVIGLHVGPAVAGPGPARDSFFSAGRPVTVERFGPATEGRRPAVILLHALDGLDGAYGSFYRYAADQCAARGYVVLLVHYFERTPMTDEEWQALRGQFLRSARGEDVGGAGRDNVRAHFDAWVGAVRDAVRYARGRPEVDGERVALVGVSLGGFLGLAAAADEGPGVAAVVSFFGGLPAERRARLTSLPPALIVHGDRDRTVPVREAQLLGDWLRAHQAAGEVKVYPGVDHVFADPNGGLNWSALRDAQERTCAFLRKYLKGQEAEDRRPDTAGR